MATFTKQHQLKICFRMAQLRVLFLFTIGFIFLGTTPSGRLGRNIEKTTHTYAIKNGESLELDLHQTAIPSTRLRSAVIFVHGGGFYTGTRKEANIIAFCDTLAEAGYLAVNMTYRLALKGKSFSCRTPLKDKIGAIATAADDVRTATKWLIDHADSLSIDPERIFLCGSSAGAEAVFHAAYNATTATGVHDFSLPESFKYLGIMAFAGAILDTAWITPENARPTLLYHGNCDPLVPYGSALHHYCDENAPGAMLFHGSYTVCNQLESLNQSVRLVTACGGKHASASYPIEKARGDIIRFIQRVESETPFTEHDIRVVSEQKCKAFGDWPQCD